MTHLPKFVFDHFDVINLFNDRLSDLRLALYWEAIDIMKKAVLKGAR
jgi:transposase